MKRLFIAFLVSVFNLVMGLGRREKPGARPTDTHKDTSAGRAAK
jgi:hypothetical protein